MNSDEQQFFSSLGQEYRDLRNPKTEERFFNNSAFQSEFRFEPGEILLYLSYQNIKYSIMQVVLPVVFIMAIAIGIPLALSVFDGLIELITILSFGGVAIAMIVFKIIAATSFRYLITNKRIVVGYTFLQRWARSVDFTNIVDIVLRKGLIGRWFNVGNLFIITGSNEGMMGGTKGGNIKNVIQMRGFLNIQQPFRVKKLIKKIMAYYSGPEITIPPLYIPKIEHSDLNIPKELQLYPDEIVYKSYKMKRASSFFKMLVPVLAIGFYGLQTIPELLGVLDLEIVLITTGIIGGGAIILFYFVSKYHSKGFSYYVTDRRIIMFKKFITIRQRDAVMGKISEISIFQMAIGRVANFGQVKIGTKGFENVSKMGSLLCIQGIEDASKEKDDIRNVVLHYQRGKFYSPLLEIDDPENFSA